MLFARPALLEILVSIFDVSFLRERIRWPVFPGILIDPLEFVDV